MRALLLFLTMTMLLAACSNNGSDDATQAPESSPAATIQPTSTMAPASPTTDARETAPLTTNPTNTIIPSQAPPTETATTVSVAPTASAGVPNRAGIDALRGGGHIILIAAFAGDCASEPALAVEDRAAARGVGVGIQGLGIPIGQVVSSADCGALDTANLTFGRAEQSDDLNDADALATLLARAPENGTNTAIVTTAEMIGAATGGVSLVNGQATIFQPGDEITLVGLVFADEWMPLAAQINGPLFQEYDVPAGSHPHDVAPALDGGVWYTAQHAGALGWLDPVTGATHEIPLGAGSAPHGVIVGPDGAPWITDGGLNAIVRVDPLTAAVQVFPLPADRPNANLNTAVFDASGIHWFTGQNGIYGRLDSATDEMEIFDAPRGPGPYGITATPDGSVYYASLAGNHIARIDPVTGAATVIEPPTAGQGARRVWSDSTGRIWVSEYNVGQVGVYDPADGSWREWPLPDVGAQAYPVYVDERDIVWLTDFTANTLVRFDPATESFESFPLPSADARVRQILGRPGEIWGAGSAVDTLIVLRVP